jgi:predicted peroxiredoxin
MAGTFCVSITASRENPDKVTVGFVVANAAVGSDKDTLVFLSADGVWAGMQGEAEKIDVGPPFSPLRELMDKFLAAGGKLLVCTPCMKKRGIAEESLVSGAKAAGGAALVEWLSNGSPCITY